MKTETQNLPPPLVEISGLSKCFGDRPALQDLTFDVRRGEIFGLLGHNGAGKSTTFGILLGMVNADAGTARIGGCCVATDRAGALGKTGAIFETPSFYEYLSGEENLRFFTSLGGLPPDERTFRETVELVGLAERIKDPVRKYSHGMRQRLALANALLPVPEFLLLDEPTDGLDPVGIHEMREMIRTLRREKNITVLLSSHLLAEVEQLCDRIAILHQGRLLFAGEWRTREPRWKFTLHPESSGNALLGGCGEVFPGGSFQPAPGVTIPEVVARLVGHGIEVHAVEPLQETLEDFYLQTSASGKRTENSAPGQ